MGILAGFYAWAQRNGSLTEASHPREGCNKQSIALESTKSDSVVCMWKRVSGPSIVVRSAQSCFLSHRNNHSQSHEPPIIYFAVLRRTSSFHLSHCASAERKQKGKIFPILNYCLCLVHKLIRMSSSSNLPCLASRAQRAPVRLTGFISIVQ